MSQHIKSLIQQLHPFLTSKTPSPSTNKSKFFANTDSYTANLFCLSGQKLKLKNKKTLNKLKNKTDQFNYYYHNKKPSGTPALNTPDESDKQSQPQQNPEQIYNSMNTSLLSIVNTPVMLSNSLCDCSRCQMYTIRRRQIEKSLKLAFSNYLKNPSEKSYANIPILVVKSFQPTTKTLSNQLDQIEIRKGSAVNALFMNDNKWVYVKTSTNQIGFIPKKCCEPFVLRKCKNSVKNVKILEEFNTPLVATATHTISNKKYTKTAKSISIPADHTYMTINEAELENLIKLQKTKKLDDKTNFTDLDADLNSNNNQTNLTLFSVSNASQNECKLSPEKLQHIQKFINACNKTNFYVQNSSEKIKAKYLNISQANKSSYSDMIKMLKKSKSHNRKLSVALGNNSQEEASLTMLEQSNNDSALRNYENLADMNCLECNRINTKQTRPLKRKRRYMNSNISPIKERSFVCSDLVQPKCKKELNFVYENLSSFKSCHNKNRIKRAKHSNQSSASSSVSSYESPTMSYLSSCSSSAKKSASSSNNNYDSLALKKTNEYLNVSSIHYLNQECELSFNEEKHIYNHLSSNNSKILNMLKITTDYVADFKDDLSVKKGDLVYLVEGANKLINSESPCNEKNNDWLFVRIFKQRRNSELNAKKNEKNTVQGFVPRSHTMKL